MLSRSGISEEFLKIGFKEFDTNRKHETVVKAKDIAIDYFKTFTEIKSDQENSIVFLSKNTGTKKTGIGTGKTHLSIAIANNIMKVYGIGAIYMPYRDVITKLKQNMIDEVYYQNEVARYKLAPLLLIDDLFKGKVNETDINIMFEIINHRYFNKLPMIVSTEYGVNDLMEFDEAVGSRIVEMSKNHLVEIGLSREEIVAGKTINYRLS